MIKSKEEFESTIGRIRRFQQQVENLRQSETSSQNYRQSAGGFLAEIDRMNLEVREYLSLLPSEVADQAA